MGDVPGRMIWRGHVDSRHTDQEISFDQFQCLAAIFNKRHSVRSAAQGLKAEGAGAGKEIQDIGMLNVAADDIKQGLPCTIRSRSDSLAVCWRGKELSAPCPSADNSQVLTSKVESRPICRKECRYCCPAAPQWSSSDRAEHRGRQSEIISYEFFSYLHSIKGSTF